MPCCRCRRGRRATASGSKNGRRATRRRGRREHSPGAEVVRVRPVPAQKWEGRAQSLPAQAVAGVAAVQS
jgi:hypothetical protein